MIPIWVISGVGGVVVSGLLASWGTYTYVSAVKNAEISRKEEGYAGERTKAAQAAEKEIRRLLDVIQKQNADLQEVEKHGQARLDIVAADRDAADLKSASLQRTANLALDALRHPAGTASTTAPDCSPATTTARVFAELFGEADRFAGVVAEEAGNARARGQTCERADAVTR
jgi:hypothetical protein